MQEQYNECREKINQFRKAEDETSAEAQEEIGNKLLNQITELKDKKRREQEKIEEIEKTQEEANNPVSEKIAENNSKVNNIQNGAKKTISNKVSFFDSIKKFIRTIKEKILKITNKNKCLPTADKSK